LSYSTYYNNFRCLHRCNQNLQSSFHRCNQNLQSAKCIQYENVRPTLRSFQRVLLYIYILDSGIINTMMPRKSMRFLLQQIGPRVRSIITRGSWEKRCRDNRCLDLSYRYGSSTSNITDIGEGDIESASPPKVREESDLQEYWKSMESRVINRRTKPRRSTDKFSARGERNPSAWDAEVV
jgi:hypothetical protein